MSENNNVMTMITKNPLLSLIVVVIIIVLIVLVVKMSGSDEAYSPSNEKVVENFPQSVPMNVMYSDANGNLGTTTDLGLQNLTVASDSSFGGALSANGKVIIGGDLGSEFNVNKTSTGWSTQFNNPTGGARIYMAHGDKNGMHINANNKDLDTYALQCVGGDKQLMILNGKGNMDVAGAVSAGSIKTGGALAAGSISTAGALTAGSISTAGALSAGGAVSANRVVLGGDLGGERSISVNKGTGDWNTQISNPTSGVNVYMAHGGKYGMHINANNKDLDTYALECYGGDKQLMTLTGKGTMYLPGSLIVGGRDILAELNRLNDRFPNNSTLDLSDGRIVNGGGFFHLVGPKGDNSSRRGASAEFRSGWGGW